MIKKIFSHIQRADFIIIALFLIAYFLFIISKDGIYIHGRIDTDVDGELEIGGGLLSRPIRVEIK